MATVKNRKDDDEGCKRAFYRMSRFFTINGEWFFCYREGEQIGPFESKGEAEQGAAQYAEHIQKSGNINEAEQAAKYSKWKSSGNTSPSLEKPTPGSNTTL